MLQRNLEENKYLVVKNKSLYSDNRFSFVIRAFYRFCIYYKDIVKYVLCWDYVTFSINKSKRVKITISHIICILITQYEYDKCIFNVAITLELKMYTLEMQESRFYYSNHVNCKFYLKLGYGDCQMPENIFDKRRNIFI